jgi:Putative auto-transporter adhesin, head GIN domain
MTAIKNKLFRVLLLSFIFLCACKKENRFDMFTSTGDIIVEKRDISNFQAIDLNDRINLFLVYDTQEYIEIEAGENLMKSIYTKVENGKLKLENNNKFNFVRSYKKEINITVHYKILRNINYYGSGSIKTINAIEGTFFELSQYDGSGNSEISIFADTVRWIAHTGPGNCNFSGSCDNAYYYSSGQAILNAENLVSNNTSVNNSGYGDFYTYASNSIGAEIYSIGNVYYKGNPQSVYRTGGGIGELIKIN